MGMFTDQFEIGSEPGLSLNPLSIGVAVQIKVDTDPTQLTNTHLIKYLLKEQAAL